MEISKKDMLAVEQWGGDGPEPSQTSSFERKTLDEIHDHDRENLKHLIERECKTYHFSNPALATSATGEALRMAMLRLGIEIDGTVSEDTVDLLLRSRGIKVETRLNYTGVESWRNGIYVYRNNEIAYFISQVRAARTPFTCEFRFSTNVDVMASPRFYTIMGGQRIISPAANTVKRLNVVDMAARRQGN